MVNLRSVIYEGGSIHFPETSLRMFELVLTFGFCQYKFAAGLYARRHDSAPANGVTDQMPFSLPHANPKEQSPKQLPQKLPILKYTRQREIEVLSGVIYIHQPMLPAKCYCFIVAKTNAAISLERVKNAQLPCLQVARHRQCRRRFHG